MNYAMYRLVEERADELAKLKIVINPDQHTVQYDRTVTSFAANTPTIVIKREINRIIKSAKQKRIDYLQSKQGRLL